MKTAVKTATWGRRAPSHGEAPAIVLVNPKHSLNVGKVVRLASCYGIKQVWWTGNRVALDAGHRLPREERMRGYQDVTMCQFDRPLEQFRDATPVAVEVRPNSELLYQFEHPANAVYIFGPEDGGLDASIARHCHRFVIIPTRHCLNLATAVATVLWDRQFKQWQGGQAFVITPGEYEQRGFADD